MSENGQAAEKPPVHTSCDKWINVERGANGTRLIVTEPARTASPERAMWANLSPRNVGELVDALLADCPRGALFAAALTDGTTR